MNIPRRLVAPLLLIVLCSTVLFGCAKPAKSPESAAAELREAGYFVSEDTEVLPDVFQKLDCELTTVLSASKKIAEEKGADGIEYVCIYYFADKEDAKKALSTVEKYASEDEDDAAASEWIAPKRSGNMIFYGTKKAIKAAR